MKPRTFEDWQKFFDAKQGTDYKLTHEECLELFQSHIRELAPLLLEVLFGHESAKNFIMFPVLFSETSEYDFDLVLHKRGKKYPCEEQSFQAYKTLSESKE
jgi:hypothetical protein